MPVFGKPKDALSPEKIAQPVKNDLLASTASTTKPATVSKTKPVKADPKTLEALQGSQKQDEDRFTFWDFLDVINPLHHIPVIATIYRAITGDEIKPPARVLGDGLYGGPIGMATGLISAMIEETTGKDVGEHAVAMILPGDDDKEENIMVAEGQDGDLNEIETSGGEEGPEVSETKAELATPAPTPDHTGQAEPIRPESQTTPPPPQMAPASSPERATPTSISSIPEEGQTKVRAEAVLSPEVAYTANDVPAAAGGHGLPPERISVEMMHALDKYEAIKRQEWRQEVYNRPDQPAPQLIGRRVNLTY